MELTIITPCTRPHFLSQLYDSINFDKITQWIIIYDVSRGEKIETKFDGNPKILELKCETPGVSGGTQRNAGLEITEDGFIYFLDDDNIIHPEFWNIFDTVESDKFYTFNCVAAINGSILYGNQCRYGTIDTSMYLVPRKIIGDIRWNNEYGADGIFIEDIYEKNKDKLCYINKVAAYYNYISKEGWSKKRENQPRLHVPTVVQRRGVFGKKRL